MGHKANINGIEMGDKWEINAQKRRQTLFAKLSQS